MPMLKLTHILPSLVIVALPLSAHAQYTQTVVDDRNQILPIFFADPELAAQQTIVPTHQQYPSRSPVVMQRPLPPVVSIPPPTTQARKPNKDPLNGPYYISDARHKIMDAAYSALGIPYVYGGNNPSRGLDCSSLMQFIHKRAIGKKLPRTAAAQRDRSKHIRYQDLQPGDLLFFKINSRTNHVGIYIGHGKFIHASSGNKRAVITSMNLPYWKKRFVKFGSYLDS